MVFSDIVEAADNLSPDEQLALVEILQRRLAERNRAALVKDVADARQEFADGNAKRSTVSEIMDELDAH